MVILSHPFAPSSSSGETYTEARYYTKLDSKQVQCQLCPNQCIIGEGERGTCRVRENQGGKLYTLSYGKPCALNVDPIEKLPLYHVQPGSLLLSNCQRKEQNEASPIKYGYHETGVRNP